MRDNCECMMTEQQSQNLLLEVDPLSTIRFITRGEILETVIATVRFFVSNITSPHLNLFIYLYLIKKHRNNVLLSYYELGFRWFELNLFSHCFDLKNLDLSKHFERLTGRTHC